MGKDIASNPLGGNADIFAPHFNADGASFPAGTDATQYSPSFDLGESLAGNFISVCVGDKPIALATAGSIEILVGDDKNADGTSTAWSTAATIAVATGTIGAGEKLGSYIPIPGQSKKYWKAKATGLEGLTDGATVNAWNESNPLAAK